MGYRTNNQWWRRHDAAMKEKREQVMTHQDKNVYKSQLLALAKVFVLAYKANGSMNGFELLGKAIGGEVPCAGRVRVYPDDASVWYLFMLRSDAVEAVALHRTPSKRNEEIVRVSWPFEL